mgnify:CR=1 FL=1
MAATSALFDWMHKQVRTLAQRAGVHVPEPARPASLDAAEVSVGLPLPPSYRRFLSLQDGWPEMWRGLTLLGTQGLQNEGTEGWDLVMFRDRYARERGLDWRDPRSLRAFDPGPGKVVPWLLLVIAIAKDGRLLGFNTREAPREGEWPLVYCDADGSVRDGFASFDAFLQAVHDERLGLNEPNS